MSPMHGSRGHLQAYLRDHEAAGQAGADLARRAAAGQRERPYAALLAELRDDVLMDLQSLRDVMRTLGVEPDRVLGLIARTGERVSRLKPHGGSWSRSRLTDLVEIESLTDAVQAKASGWRALLSAELAAPGMPDLTELARRAEDQTSRLVAIHRLICVDALRPTPG